ncbi:LCP family protein [Streptomyces regalis]|uniref:Transcriptional regulator n=1 Tax=Streptomyces regalis TaxID=68262 RepID=A0A101J5M1_9ACTN|nr:LCP family protein [Streptomyces regalis]KUL20674.1 transcriptional regulator [Streptomyces regalis]
MNDWNGETWNGETQAPRVITGHVIAHTEQTQRAEQVRPYEEPVRPAAPGPYEARPGGGHTRSTRPRWVRPSRRRRVARLLALLLCALFLTGGGTYVWADFALDRAVDLGEVGDRPPPGKGTTYLIVGSDSRDGLSEQAKKDLHAGGGGGSRTDSMMLLHTGAHGTTLVSLPRDSWVTLPSYLDPATGKRHRPAKDKLNAAYSLGGARLLVRTVELNAGIRVDHYAEIGFGGFVGVVDAVGGVDMCVDRTLKDEKSGLDLTKGCHTLDGAQALAFVRQRHQEAQGDLGRSRNQQKFLAALAHQAAAPGTALNPLRVYPLLNAALDTLVVDKDMQLRTLASLFRAMSNVSSGNGRQLNVPVAGVGISTSKGSAVKWDAAKAKQLFTELRNDRPVSIEEIEETEEKG